jgi:glycosyltransferase involved in cell wall biosynthesis
MRVRRILLDTASAYEAKCFRADTEIMEGGALVAEADADLLHFYGGAPGRDLLPRALPYVASAAPQPAKLPWRRIPPPALLIPPGDLPEPVERQYSAVRPSLAPGDGRYAVGFYGQRRPGVRELAEQAAARIDRFRDDIDWLLFDTPPAATEFRPLHLWIDPAVIEEDRDGFVAEAVVAGMLVVATRTAVNEQRLDGGRAGFLVPHSDPNELAHAILTALFKEEIAAERRLNIAAAAAKYDPFVRRRELLAAYGRVAR